MTPQDHRELIRRMLLRVQTGTTDEASQLMEVPADEFLCPQRLERERQRFFLDTPQVIGFAGEVARPGSYLTGTVMDVPVLVTRAEDGVLRAFINACAHRGARVAHGCGLKKRLTCGFHGWSYALDGTLAGRRAAKAFDGTRSANGLVSLPVSDRGGLIAVGPRPDMDPGLVEQTLDGIAPVLEGFDFHTVQPLGCQRYEVSANWKLVVGLSHEGYHFATLHRDSLAPLMHDNGVVDTFGRHTRWAFALRGIERLAEQDPAEWPERFPGTMNHTIFPGTVIVVNQDDAEMIRVEPGETPGRSVVHYSGVSLRQDNIEARREAYEFGGQLFTEEDLPAAVECQQGLAAGLSAVVIGRNEPVVQFWHRCWNDMLEVETGAT